MIKRLLFVLALLFAVMQASAQTYTYDNLNRLTKVVYDNDVTVTYTYDALGNRTKKTVTGASDPKEAYAWLSNDSTILTFCYDSDREERVGTTYDLNEDYNYPDWNPNPWGSPRDAITSVVFDSSFAQARPVSTYCWFHNLSKLTEITGLRYLNTSNVENMVCMFRGCSSLEYLDVSNFNTDNVTSMSSMFYGCNGLTSLDVSNFNTVNVSSMWGMFYYCSGLTSLDVSNFDTENVTDMMDLFHDCSNLRNLDVSNFNTANVTDMTQMFWGCSSLEYLDVSNFNTDNVMSMSSMFAFCNRLTSLDLSNFNTAKVNDMTQMFLSCSKLATIYAGDGWGTTAVTWSTNMFSGCTSLVGGKGTTFDFNHTDKAYAHIDGGLGYPGYFTEGPALLFGDVDGDGRVNIDDLAVLIDYLLTGKSDDVNLSNADCYVDGRVNVDDLAVLIDYLLTGSWN